ncbi:MULTISPECIES: c-type cytochrome [Flavobacterium]|uniref:c-type cytochrome n=1 Tax=Flavobacterium TaxID=237 RepID=UPI0009631A61|nr:MULTISPECIES: c-type cytochrome [Flavobacterium]MBN9284428.1 cytochrome c [Flavobacterium sp.]OJV72730.1 MAG: cytochrome C [Flavobacterium sp. 40-81]
MNRFFLLLSGCFLLLSCGKEKGKTTDDFSKQTVTEQASDPSAYDAKRGEGKFKNVEIGAGIDASLADQGDKVVGVKCLSCHKTSDEKLVGPGWKGVTERRAPEWIMNFITNPDPMIDKDPELQAQLEICLVRMPNQAVTDDEARQILEFMRRNDAAK